MKFILTLVLLLPTYTFAFEFIRSATFSLETISSNSDLRTSEDEILLTFIPNVSTGFGIGIETDYITLGYVLAGKDPQRKDLQESKFRDIKLDFSIYDFDIRLNYQSYKGALVENGDVKKFYRDYEVQAYNFRAHYYFNDSILKFVRDGKKLTNASSENIGFNSISSWFLGASFDSRKIFLPQTLEPFHQSILDQKMVQYANHFDVFSYGPLGGYDYFMLYHKFFLRGKLGYGKSIQRGGKFSDQFELALSFGISIKKDHALSINVDAYIMSFKEGNQNIQNQNDQANIEYNIAF